MSRSDFTPRSDWQNKPSHATPLKAEDLLRYEAGINGSAAVADVGTPGTTTGDAIAAAIASHGGGSTLTPTATKTATYTAAVGDLAMMNVAGGGSTLNLPTAPVNKAQVAYRAIGATTAVPLTVNRGGSTDAIGTAGATSAIVTFADEVVVLQYDAPNTRWLAVANVKTQTSLDVAYAKNPGRVILDQARLDSSSATQVSGGSIGRAYSIPDAANTWVGGVVDFPADWHTVNVDAWVAPLATATGNVVLQLGSMVLTDGSLTTANPTTVAAVTVVLPATAFTLKVVRVATTLAVDPSGPMYLRVLRLGNDAGDTSTQAITIVRMDVTKAS
jgi:hypothetical protein